jgi:5-formyltetrahydrofolate cyclo-ligase
MDAKSDLRQTLTARREAAFVSNPNVGQALALNFPKAIVIDPNSVVAGYMPFRTEIDVRPLIHILALRGAPIAMPKIEKTINTTSQILFYLCDINDQEDFRANKWGIYEPRSILPKVVPNVIIVPLLGFDRRGNRIGYGKGYYDRAIAYLKAQGDVITIGLAYAEQEVDEVPTQHHDQRLDWIITQNEAYRCPS